MNELPKRKWCYVMPPGHFDVAPCPCGNQKTQWSEFEKHCWCKLCQKDFIPYDNGIFDGPISVKLVDLIGINFDRVNLETDKIERWDSEKMDWIKEEA